MADTPPLTEKPPDKWPQVGYPRVRGRCPSCGADSLFLGSNGYVTCAVIGCKDPGAPTDVLAVGPESDAWQWRNRAMAAERQVETLTRGLSLCDTCGLTWIGPYTDCPGCQAQVGMKGISDLGVQVETLTQGRDTWKGAYDGMVAACRLSVHVAADYWASIFAVLGYRTDGCLVDMQIAELQKAKIAAEARADALAKQLEDERELKRKAVIAMAQAGMLDFNEEKARADALAKELDKLIPVLKAEL